MQQGKPLYRRILLKLSGEALQSAASSIDAQKLESISQEIAEVIQSGVQIALVVGAGNILRGAGLESMGLDRVTADQMGMLATMINGLALRDALNAEGVSAKIMSAIAAPGLVDFYNRQHAIDALKQNQVVIFVAGTGNPLVTTDSAAALRGIEIEADIVFKATKVDGVFAADPVKNPKAQRYTSLTYDEVLEQRLGVMDLNAILLCQEHQLPLRVFNMSQPSVLKKILYGADIGTLIQTGA